MMGLRGIWNVNRDDVTPPKQILNRVCYLKAQTWNSARSDNVVAENVGLKSYREDARDFVPDTPGSSDNSDLLRLQFFAHQLVLNPPALLHTPIRERDLPEETEHQPDSQFSNARCSSAWSVENNDSFLLGCLN